MNGGRIGCKVMGCKAMRNVASTILMMMALAGCSAPAVEPIPGSITYGGQPQTKLTKAPVGSTFTKRLIDQNGRRAEETYRVQPDRSLKLISRRSIEFDFPDGR
ncbi:hypothetical protein RHI9324_02594 [Rhizobium sp. CECT 9324]|nr:hypothetical protein RHI9324_02594 [Rhizobium sp. CECT 9324]